MKDHEPWSDEKFWGFMLSLILISAMIPFDAWALSIMWGWFVVPLGMMAIGKAHAYGLAILLSLARYRPRKDIDYSVRALLGVYAVEGMMLLTAWFAQGFMQ